MKSLAKSFSDIYDSFSPIVYGIALQNSNTKKEADEILVLTFQKFHNQNSIEKSEHCIWATLVKLTAQTVKEYLKKSTVVIKQFQHTPILHKILCENMNIKEISDQNRTSTTQIAKTVRSEITSLRNLEKFVLIDRV